MTLGGVRLFPFLSLLLFLAVLWSPGAVAQEEPSVLDWGLHDVGEGDAFLLPAPAGVMACTANGNIVHLRADAADGTTHRHVVGDGEPGCVLLQGRDPLRVEEVEDGGDAQVLLFLAPMGVLDFPAVMQLPRPGAAVLVSGVTSQGEVTLRPGGPEADVIALEWEGLGRLPVDRSGPEWRLDVPAQTSEVFVMAIGGSDEATLLRWSDPGWFPVSPSLGHALTAAALALFVTLFKSGAGGAFVKPGEKKAA